MKGAQCTVHSAHSLHCAQGLSHARTSSPQALMDCHRHSPTSTISNLFLHIQDLLHSLFCTLTQNSRNQFTNPLFLWKKRLKLLCYSTRSNTLRTSGTFPLDLQTHTFFPLTSQHHHFLYDTDSEVLQPIRLDLFRQWSESDIVIETALLLSLKRSLDHIQFVALQKDFHQTVFQKKRRKLIG